MLAGLQQRFTWVSVSGRAEATRAREACELNVDLSSAGCGSEEPHWQAEHRIHPSVRSKPGSCFSEVDEQEGTQGPSSRRAVCVSALCVLSACVCVCVLLGRGGVGTCAVSPGKDLAL